MHDETKSTLIENGASIVGSLVKDRVVHRRNLEKMEMQKEKELELARLRNEKAPDPGENITPDRGERESRTIQNASPQEVSAAIDELIHDEECAVCRELLEALKGRPPREQVRGIMEFGTFKRELAGDGDVDQLRASLQETDVLRVVMQEDVMGA